MSELDAGGAAPTPELRQFLQGLRDRVVMDTSEREPVYLLARENGVYMRLSPSAYHLLRLMAEGLSREQIAERVGPPGGAPASMDEVNTACNRVLERVQELERNFKPGTFGLRLRTPVLGARAVGWLATPLVVAFTLPGAAVLLAGIAAAVYAGLGYQWPSTGFRNSADFWPAYGLLIVSLMVHELGHASACKRYGASPAEIGAGFYFVLPAFYSNVTDAWRLRRWQRIVVDIAGVYFQLAIGAVFVLVFEVTGRTEFRTASLLVVVNCLFTLNPILRFDGYWLMSDILGITNLRSDGRRLIGQLWDRVRGRPPRPLPWAPHMAALLLVYAALTTFLLTRFVIQFLPALVQRNLVGLVPRARELTSDLWYAPGTVGLGRVMAFVFSLLIAYLLLATLWRLGSQLAKGLAALGRGAVARVRRHILDQPSGTA